MSPIILTLPAETVAAVDDILAQRRREEGSAPDRLVFLQDLFAEVVAREIRFVAGREAYDAIERATDKADAEERRRIHEHPDQSLVSVELPAGLIARVDACLDRLQEFNPEWCGHPREAFLERMIEDGVVMEHVSAMHDERRRSESETAEAQTHH